MSEERPIRSLLVEDASEAELQRVWRGVQQRRGTRASPHRPWLAVFAVISLIAGVWLLRPSASTAGPLRDAQGQALGTLGALAASSSTLGDGSRIELSAGAKLEVLDNDGTTFACALRHGRTLFDVVPGGPRRWRIEAGAVRVEVVGTRFSVERNQDQVFVAVERGTVVVRGERVPDGVERLDAGKSLLIDTASAATKATPAPTPPPEPAPTQEASAPTASAASSSRPTLAGLAGADLLKFADEQRQKGNLRGAIQALRAAVERGPDDSRRAIAAFTLGKLLLDGAGQPAEAKAAFRSCLRLSPPAAMAEDALARLVEAEARVGGGEAARGTAREYEKRYPNGRRLLDVRRWANIR